MRRSPLLPTLSRNRHRVDEPRSQSRVFNPTKHGRHETEPTRPNDEKRARLEAAEKALSVARLQAVLSLRSLGRGSVGSARRRGGGGDPQSACVPRQESGGVTLRLAVSLRPQGVAWLGCLVIVDRNESEVRKHIAGDGVPRRRRRRVLLHEWAVRTRVQERRHVVRSSALCQTARPPARARALEQSRTHAMHTSSLTQPHLANQPGGH